jgi:ABC-2 type transport system permease protein
MNANIYKHEFSARLRSVLTWSLGIAVLVIFYTSIFQSFSEQAAVLNEMMAKFPPQLLAAFGMGSIDFSTLLGFYSLIFIFVQLCLAIQAANYGFGLVSVEETELTADFLMTKPVSRMQVINSKLLAALTSLTITNLVVWVITFIGIQLFGGDHPYELSTLLLLLLSILIFQLFFLSLGLAISLLVKRVRSVTPYALGLAFGAYILSAFSGIFGEVKLELITPFKHFDPAYIVRNAAYDTPLVLLNVAVTFVALVVAYWLYIAATFMSVIRRYCEHLSSRAKSQL